MTFPAGGSGPSLPWEVLRASYFEVMTLEAFVYLLKYSFHLLGKTSFPY
jgi:hypothetical protein